MAMAITSGKKTNLAHKLVIYGVEGIGKTTLAMNLPGPVLFIDTEGGTSRYPVDMRMEPESWEDILDTLREIEREPAKYGIKSLVIDTMDWAVDLMAQSICKAGRKKSIEDFGYGAGYAKMNSELPVLLRILTAIWKRGINICLVAHAKKIKFELPEESGSFDKYELKLDQKSKDSKLSDMVKEWADTVLFCNYKTNVFTDGNGKHKAVGYGSRAMYTTHHAVWDAKNRDGLPDELPLDYSAIRHIFEAEPAQIIAEPEAQGYPYNDNPNNTKQIDPRLLALMDEDKIDEVFVRDIIWNAFEQFKGYQLADLPADFISFLEQPDEWRKLMNWAVETGLGQPF